MFELISFFILIIITFIWINYENNKEEIKKDKENNIICKVSLQHVSGLENLVQNIECKIAVNEEQLFVDDKYVVKLSNIKSTQIIKGKELLEQEKSMLGRALVGGILLGGIGAVIGSMTALKNEKQMKDVDFLLIDYINSKNENAQLVFMAVENIEKKLAKYFSNTTNELINYTPPPILNSTIEL